MQDVLTGIVGAMSTDEAPIYRDLLRFKPDDLTLNGWAIAAGVSRAVWADMRRHGNPSRRTLDKLLTAAGSSLAEFEALRVGPEKAVTPNRSAGLVEDYRPSSWSAGQLPSLPLVRANLAGEFGSKIPLIEICVDEITERLPRPPSLGSDPGAFAVTILARSMLPRFRPGRHVAVSPQSPIAIGDDVLVMLQDGRRAVIGELVRRSNDSIELRQHSPDQAFSIENGEVGAIQRIAGELI